MRRRSLHRRFLTLGAIIVAGLVTPALASADCGDQIVDEVFNTGNVDGAYALRCYDLAITKLEGDAAEYSEARGIISAAKITRRNQLAAQAEQEQTPEETPDPVRSDSAEPADGGRGDGSGTGGGSAGPSEDGGAEAEDPTTEGRAATDEVVTDEATTDAELSEEDVTTAAAPASFDDGDDGTPVPVLLLGGLAIVLIGVGAGGMVWRRLNP